MWSQTRWRSVWSSVLVPATSSSSSSREPAHLLALEHATRLALATVCLWWNNEGGTERGNDPLRGRTFSFFDLRDVQELRRGETTPQRYLMCFINSGGPQWLGGGVLLQIKSGKHRRWFLLVVIIDDFSPSASGWSCRINVRLYDSRSLSYFLIKRLYPF